MLLSDVICWSPFIHHCFSNILCCSCDDLDFAPLPCHGLFNMCFQFLRKWVAMLWLFCSWVFAMFGTCSVSAYAIRISILGACCSLPFVRLSKLFLFTSCVSMFVPDWFCRLVCLCPVVWSVWLYPSVCFVSLWAALGCWNCAEVILKFVCASVGWWCLH